MELNSHVEVKTENNSLKLNCETDGTEEVMNYLSQDCTVDQERLVESDCNGISESTVTLPVNSVTGTLIEHGSLQLSDGSTAYIESITNQLDEGHNVAVQLEDGTTAFIRTANKDGLQAVQLHDGTTAFISHTLDLEEFTTRVLDSVESVEMTNISLGKSQASSSSVRSGVPRITKTVSLGDKAFRCPYEGCDRLSAHGITESIEITDVHTEDVSETGEQSESEEGNQIQVEECHRIEVTVVDSNGETIEVSKSENMHEQPVQLQLNTGESSSDILPESRSFTAIQ
ncbi:hypothetical protein CHUAL_009111 [Chamberlinius hualienensis]